MNLPVNTSSIPVNSIAVAVNGFVLTEPLPPAPAPAETGPELVLPYCGQNQTSQIQVPATVAYKEPPYAQEEGPWNMIPYAQLYPPGSQTETTDVVPPPVKMIDIFSAQQTWPL